MPTAVLRMLVAAIGATLLSMLLSPPATAAANTITIRAKVDEVLIGKTFNLFGTTNPSVRGLVVTRQVYRQKTWKTTGSAMTNRKGDWKMVVTAPAWEETLKLRVQAKIKGKVVTSAVVVVEAVPRLSSAPKQVVLEEPVVDEGPVYEEPIPLPDWQSELQRANRDVSPTVVIAALGKGGRILGADIARYQHPVSRLFPDGAPINFNRMYEGGVRFLYIKASDGRDPGHNNAERWYANDRRDAQAAGIYTGFYHYAYFPASTLAADIIADAQAQADKALWRLSSVGGYNDLDLPFALDIEEACVVRAGNGNCSRSVTKNAATLWTKAWLARMYERTGRKPVVYSSPAFLQGYLNRDPELRQYPLWLAHYDRDPGVPSNFPGMKSDGTCFIHAWTLNNCASDWAIWQYTSSGKATSFGIAGGNLDLNLYSGTSTEFVQFASGTWTPNSEDFLPFNETTTLNISNLVYSVNTAPVTASVKVTRPSGLPVVSGALSASILAGPDGVAPTPEQLALVRVSTTRTGVGAWELRMSGLPSGAWTLVITFTDPSRVHATSSSVQSVTITALAIPTPVAPDTATATNGQPPAPAPSQTPSP